MYQAFLVGVGGFIGSIARFLICRAAERICLAFPLGTLLANSTASLILGFIMGTVLHHPSFPENLRIFLSIGLLGGFSTFSAFSGETLIFLQNRDYAVALMNILLNVSITLAAVAIGFSVASGFFCEEPAE